MSTQAAKDTIYIDIDDEITSIIDKVRSADNKVVALVLPKRATVLQSIVNMKLLKRTADEAKKHLVLITSEAGLLPLAGNVGIHVASTLQSKPEIPNAPVTPGDEPEDVDEPLNMANEDDAEEDFDASKSGKTPVGKLAGAAIAAPAIDETFELDNSDGALSDKPTRKKLKKNRKLKVPNFESFRIKLILGAVLLIALIVGWIFAFTVLPKAKVTIHTDTSTIPTNLDLNLTTAAKKLDVAKKTLPAIQQSEQKSYTQQVATTGQINNGVQATGTVDMTACYSGIGFPSSVPSGTGVSTNGHTYITQQNTTFDTFVGPNSSNTCNEFSSSSSTSIVALKGGSDYNVSSADFTVSGRPDVTATGSASGGTDNITKVVAQADIDQAKSKISAGNTETIKQDLQSALKGQSLYPVDVTFVAGDPKLTTSAKVGDKADSVSVTEVITYTMLGIHKSDLQKLVDANVNSQLDKGKQVILNDGVDNATFEVQNQVSATNFSVAVSTKSVAGPQIDTATIRKQIAGKKSGDIKSMLKGIPGVTGVNVKYSPFWVTSTPKNIHKITVLLDKSNTGQS